jgi:cytoplasmic iron level regulating protein YaaA (DUF328/UPF0246 family)
VSQPVRILVPPSEGKTAGGDGPKWAAGTTRFDALDRPRRAVMTALQKGLAGDAAALLGVKGDALAAAVRADRAVRRSPTMPAIERFNGVLYDALDARSLSARARRRLDERVVILSGLFGALGPSDPIPDHKLKMSASLPGVGRLATFWRPHLDAALQPELAGATVWDLLPNEHAAALSAGGPAGGSDGDSAAHRIVVRFLDDVERDGERRLVTVSHWNKLLKGALVRHLVTTGADDHASLAAFTHPQGYAYRPELTTVDGSVETVSMVAVR